MGIYASVTDVEEYIEGGTGLDADTVERYIGRAQRSVDLASGFRATTAGLHFNPAQLISHQADALKNATCAQVEYMLGMGDTFFVEGQPESFSDEEGSQTGRLPRTGPKVKEELRYGGMLMTTARMR